ncbi:Calcium/calmodulin-dependent protein kinase II isoform [Penicillium camemberti]|uniref:non-specific serine/threonine protein kinase n=1 Tax=Penicillium camemberti (strain FM 013) TaxID=1429867 RepID=A0A0G4PAU6_PENC3|nr:Calcium/calmodulin-dependent protein kinase II isoform [Penicillium camemberti]
MITTFKKALSRVNSQSWLLKYFGPDSQPSRSPTPQRTTEEPDFYSTGGFHPVSSGDTFNSGTYKVMRKLGYGQYSTVWLARDSKAQRYMALKIPRADCYGGSHDIFELEILLRLSDIARKNNHGGRNFVLPLLDQFKHEGPNGKHAVRTIVRQLLLGLDFLHRECGIIHTGMAMRYQSPPTQNHSANYHRHPDLKPTNILLELETPEEPIEKYLTETTPRITTEGCTTKPLREVITTPLISEMRDLHIRIVDFGVASWSDNHLSDMVQSPALRAPEVTIGAHWDAKVDIWSLGCLIIEFVQGIVPFSGVPSKNGSSTVDDDRLARTIEILGDFPPELLRKGSKTAEFFNTNGSLLRISDLIPTSLERLINGAERHFLKPNDMSDAEIPIFIDFLQGMLTIDPARRKSAAELLRHEWLEL